MDKANYVEFVHGCVFFIVFVIDVFGWLFVVKSVFALHGRSRVVAFFRRALCKKLVPLMSTRQADDEDIV